MMAPVRCFGNSLPPVLSSRETYFMKDSLRQNLGSGQVPLYTPNLLLWTAL